MAHPYTDDFVPGENLSLNLEVDGHQLFESEKGFTVSGHKSDWNERGPETKLEPSVDLGDQFIEVLTEDDLSSERTSPPNVKPLGQLLVTSAENRVEKTGDKTSAYDRNVLKRVANTEQRTSPTIDKMMQEDFKNGQPRSGKDDVFQFTINIFDQDFLETANTYNLDSGETSSKLQLGSSKRQNLSPEIGLNKEQLLNSEVEPHFLSSASSNSQGMAIERKIGGAKSFSTSSTRQVHSFTGGVEPEKNGETQAAPNFIQNAPKNNQLKPGKEFTHEEANTQLISNNTRNGKTNYARTIESSHFPVECPNQELNSREKRVVLADDQRILSGHQENIQLPTLDVYNAEAGSSNYVGESRNDIEPREIWRKEEPFQRNSKDKWRQQSPICIARQEETVQSRELERESSDESQEEHLAETVEPSDLSSEMWQKDEGTEIKYIGYPREQNRQQVIKESLRPMNEKEAEELQKLFQQYDIVDAARLGQQIEAVQSPGLSEERNSEKINAEIWKRSLNLQDVPNHYWHSPLPEHESSKHELRKDEQFTAKRISESDEMKRIVEAEIYVHDAMEYVSSQQPPDSVGGFVVEEEMLASVGKSDQARGIAEHSAEATSQMVKTNEVC